MVSMVFVMFAKGVLMVLMISNVVLEKIPRICGVIGSTSNNSSNGWVSVPNGELPLFTHGPMAMSWGNSHQSGVAIFWSLWFTQKELRWKNHWKPWFLPLKTMVFTTILPRIFVCEKNDLLFEVSLSLPEASVFSDSWNMSSETRKDEVNCIVLRLEIADTIG